jgi:hypothetical protein
LPDGELLGEEGRNAAKDGWAMAVASEAGQYTSVLL